MDKAKIRKKIIEIEAKLGELELQHDRAVAASDLEQTEKLQEKMSGLVQQKEDLQAKLAE